MIDAPQLWLPDRLRERREDERLLRAVGRGGVSRRWMPGYPCCCGLTCNSCTGKAPDEVTLRVSGVVAPVAGLCDQGECDAAWNTDWILTPSTSLTPFEDWCTYVFDARELGCRNPLLPSYLTFRWLLTQPSFFDPWSTTMEVYMTDYQNNITLRHVFSGQVPCIPESDQVLTKYASNGTPAYCDLRNASVTVLAP